MGEDLLQLPCENERQTRAKHFAFRHRICLAEVFTRIIIRSNVNLAGLGEWTFADGSSALDRFKPFQQSWISCERQSQVG